MVTWEIKGWEFGNCNCNYGCPCQFNALPTHGHCRGLLVWIAGLTLFVALEKLAPFGAAAVRAAAALLIAAGATLVVLGWLA